MKEKNGNANMAQNSTLPALGSTEGGRIGPGSAFRECGLGCEVNSQGDVRKIGTVKILKPQDRKGIGPQRYCISYQGKKEYPARWLLVARAWLNGWKEGMCCTWNNDDMKDCRVENLSPCTKSEYRIYSTNLSLVRKAEREGVRFGEFRPTDEPGIECTKDGVFRIDGKISNHHIRWINGRLKLRTIEVKRHGVMKYYNAKELIYKTWNGKILPDNEIMPADGDWCNINADNLVQVRVPTYRRAAYHWQQRVDGDVNSLPTIDEEIERLEEMKREIQMGINYLRTGKFDEYHKYITDYLYNYLMCYSMKTLDKSRSWAERNVGIVLSDLYDCISTNRLMYSPKMFCAGRLRRYKRFHTTFFAHKGRPVAIERAINDLELDQLAAKFNTSSLKKFHHHYGI